MTEKRQAGLIRRSLPALNLSAKALAQAEFRQVNLGEGERLPYNTCDVADPPQAGIAPLHFVFV